MFINKTSKWEKYDSYVTWEHPTLEVGTNVIIHNTSNSAKARWEKTGTAVEKLPFSSYCIEITGSGWIVIRNRKFIKAITLSTNRSIILSPLHNHTEIQNNPDI